MEVKNVEVIVNSTTRWWYESRGYVVPKSERQLFCKSSSGGRIKNGVAWSVKRGTKIIVSTSDLLPKSRQKIKFTCGTCGKQKETIWSAYYTKHHPDICLSCASSKTRGPGAHCTWVKRLITNNSEAKCDISGETDKRFLVLHHLTSQSVYGKSANSNYVVLTANYHLAFHAWNGGMNKPCYPYQYEEFKELELKRIIESNKK
jgi:hypothetical protein